MSLTPEAGDPWLLDPDVRESPDRLSDLDLFIHAGPGWRRNDLACEDPEENP